MDNIHIECIIWVWAVNPEGSDWHNKNYCMASTLYYISSGFNGL